MTSSTEHDPLCPFGGFYGCSCHLIAKVRADEREKLLQAMRQGIESVRASTEYSESQEWADGLIAGMNSLLEVLDD